MDNFQGDRQESVLGPLSVNLPLWNLFLFVAEIILSAKPIKTLCISALQILTKYSRHSRNTRGSGEILAF